MPPRTPRPGPRDSRAGWSRVDTPSIGRLVQADALHGLQDQLIRHAGEYGYTVQRRTIAPHVGYLSVQELVVINRSLPQPARRYTRAAALVEAMVQAPTRHETDLGVHPAVARNRPLAGGLVFGSFRRSSRGEMFRRVYLQPADPAEADGLRREAVAVRERLTGQPMTGDEVTALPPLTIPLVNIVTTPGKDPAAASLQGLLGAEWAMPASITLGPLAIVDTASASV